MENNRGKKKFKSLRLKTSPLYLDLVNVRLERRWDGLDALQKVRSKFGDSAKYVDLAAEERSLDAIFMDYKPNVEVEVPVPPAILETLTGLAGPLDQEPGDWFILEARLLLAKMYFTCGKRTEAMTILKDMFLHELQPEAGWPIHAIRLLAECTSLRGWALQQLISTSEHWQAEAPAALEVLQQAADVLLVYFQELTVAVNPSAAGGKPANASAIVISPWMEAAVHHMPLLHLLLGDTASAVEVLRAILRVAENPFSKTLRLSAARQLALLLLRAPHIYTAPPAPPPPTATVTQSSSMPRVHPTLNRPEHLHPDHQAEELVLVLTIAEGLVRQEAVQSRFPNDRPVYEKWHEHVSAVYDLAVLALGTFGKSHLVDLLEQSMRFSFDNEHIWLQFGLALISGGQYDRACMVLKHCLQQYPESKSAALMLCKLYINHIPNADEAISFAEKVVEQYPAMAAGRLALGLAYALQARKQMTHSVREGFAAKAIASLQAACERDPRNPACALHCALQMATQRRVTEAMVLVLNILQMDPTHHDALWLLILLQTSLKNYVEALTACTGALDEYPGDMAFVKLKVEIEATTSGVASALVAAKATLNLAAEGAEPVSEGQCELWLLFTDLFLQNGQFEDASSCFKKVPDNLSAQSLYYRGRLLAHELRLDDAKNCFTSALATNPAHVDCMLALAGLHFNQDNSPMAEQYISQALALNPGNHIAWRHRGSVLRAQGEHERAADCFVNALQLEARAPVAPFTDITLQL